MANEYVFKTRVELDITDAERKLAHFNQLAAQGAASNQALNRDIQNLQAQRESIVSSSQARQQPIVDERARQKEIANNPLYAGIGGIQPAARQAQEDAQRQLDAEKARQRKELVGVDAQIATLTKLQAKRVETQNELVAERNSALKTHNDRISEAEKQQETIQKEINAALDTAEKQIRKRAQTTPANLKLIAQGEVASNTSGTEINAEVDRQKAADDLAGRAYRNAVVDLTTQINRKRAAIDNQLADDPAYKKAVIEATTAQRRQTTTINDGLAKSKEYIAAQAENAAAIRLRTAREKEARLGLQPLAGPGADVGVIEAQNAAQADREKAAATRRYFAELNPEGIRALAQEVGAAKAEQEIYNKQVAAAAAATKGEAENAKILGESEAQLAKTNAQVAAAKSKAIVAQVQADEIAQKTNPSVKTLPQLQASTAQDDLAINAKKVIAENELLLSDEGKESVRLKAQANVLQQQVNDAIKTQEKVIRSQQGSGIALGGGTFTQNFQQSLTSRNGDVTKAATDYATLGQLIQGALITTGKFAVAGSVFFGVSTAIHQTFTETALLEKEFATLQVTLENTGKGDQFAALKDSIFSISRETGIASSQLTNLALQFQGAFGDKSAAFIQQQVEGAAKIEAVTGLSTAETVDALTALNKTFGVTANQIGDTTQGLQQRFGVLAGQITTFTSQVAPAAAQAGFTFKQLAAIGAGLQQSSGRTGSALAESFGRVVGGLQDNASTIVGIFLDNPALKGKADQVASDFAHGYTSKVLLELQKDYPLLSKAQQNSLASALGGSRQAPVLAGLFGSTTLRNELQKPVDDAGKLDQAFGRLQDTIAQTFNRLKQAALQIGIGIAEAGVIPLLKDIANVIQLITGFLSPFIQAFQTVSGLFKDIAGVDLAAKLVEAGLLFKAISAYGAARAAGGSVREGVTSGLTLGLAGGPVAVGPTRAQQLATDRALVASTAGVYGPFTQAETTSVAAAQANIAKNNIAGRFKEMTGQFFTGVSKGIGDVASDKTRLGVTAGGAALAVVGSQVVGGSAGNTLSGIGTGLSVGALAESPVLGAVVGGSQILSGFLDAAKTASAQAKDMASKYADLAQSSDGQKQLNDVLKQKGPLHKNFLEDLSGIFGNPLSESSYSPDTQLAQQKDAAARAQQEQQAAETRAKLELAKKQLNPKSAQFKEISDAEAQSKVIGAFDPAAGFNYLEDFAHKLISSIEHGQKKGIDIAKLYKQFFAQNPEKGTLAQFLKTEDVTSSQSLLDASASDYQSGLATQSQYRAQLQEAVKTQEVQIRAGGSGTKFDALRRAHAKNQSDLAKLDSQNITDELTNQRQIDQYTGGGDQFTTVVADVKALANPKFKDLSQRASTLNDLFTTLHAIVTTQAADAPNAAAKVAILNKGISIPEPARVDIAFTGVNRAIQSRPKISAELQKASDRTGIGVNDLTRTITQDSLENDRTIAQATADLYNFLADEDQQLIDAIKKAHHGKLSKADRAKLKGLQSDVKSFRQDATDATNNAFLDGLSATAPTDVTGTPEEKAAAAKAAQDKANSDAKRLAAAQADYLKALAEKNPVATAQAELQGAYIELSQAVESGDAADQVTAQARIVRALHAITDANNAIIKAQIAYNKALVSNDPVKAAEQDIRAAYFDLTVALANGDQAAALQAAAALESAGRAYKQTLFDITSSAATLAEAMANFSGNTVEAARLSLDQLRSKLAYAKSQGAGQSEVNGIQTEIINQQAALRDAQLKEKEDTIDFNLQVKNISTAQAIASYQALLANATVLQLTTQERRDLILKIYQLKQGLTQDLQFDLPTDLNLPTLYEARRVSQLGTASNYQDNRNVTITLNSTDPASTQAAVAQINDALNAPSVFGSGTRRY